MARAIEGTPTLHDKDARLFLKQVFKYYMNPNKKKELEKCAKLFEKMKPKYG